jgi:hypothetical protein
VPVVYSARRRVYCFFGGHILPDLAWYSFVAALVATGRRVLNDGVYRGLILACAAFLLGLGVWFLVSERRFPARLNRRCVVQWTPSRASTEGHGELAVALP